jgi:hypothetical protein
MWHASFLEMADAASPILTRRFTTLPEGYAASAERMEGALQQTKPLSPRPEDAGQDYEEMDRLAMSAFAGTTT